MTETEGAAVAEQSVLGSMMLSPKAAADVVTMLRTEDFAVPRHACIFDALAELVRIQAPTDVVAVTDQLVKSSELTAAGGAAYLHHLTSVPSTASSAAYHATIVRTDATRRGLHEIGTRLSETIADPGVTLARALNDLSDLRDQTVSGAVDSKARWLADVLDVPEDEDAHDWVIPNVLERQDRLMLSAAEGVGKSTLLRQFAVLSAAGIHPFRFSPITPIRVLVIDAENSERQWRRATRGISEHAHQIGMQDPRTNIALHCVNLMDITQASDLGRIHKWMDEVKPDLLILGPLYRLVAGGLNKDEEAQAALRALDSLRERDVAMLIEVHAGHARSTSGERDLRPRGSSQLLGWPEFGIGLQREKELINGRAYYRLVKWRGDRDARVWPRLTRGQQWPWEPTA